MHIKVLICDDQELARAGMRFVLEALPEIEIVGEADSGQSAQDLTACLHPDLVLMDVVMPDENGIETARRIIRSNPQVRVLAVSMHTEAMYICAMLEAGASGYVDKSCAYEELVVAIHEVMAGRKYLGPSLGARARPGGDVWRACCPGFRETEVAAPIIAEEQTR